MHDSYIITRLRSFAEYYLLTYFVARFNDVYASGYNSAGSERTWIKFGKLRADCLEQALADCGRDPRRSEASFCFFCLVSNADFTDFRSAKFHKICTQDVDLRSGESFRNKILKIFPQEVVFF